MSESMQEKTEKATPRRRQEARKKGSVAKSMDLTSAATMTAVLFVLPATLVSLMQGFFKIFKSGMAVLPHSLDPSESGPFVMQIASPVLPALTILIGTIMAVGVASNLAQVGFQLTGEALKPNFARLNPAAGIKRMLGMNSVVETLKSSLKFGVFLFIAYQVLTDKKDTITNLGYYPAAMSLSMIGEIIKTIATRIVTAWVFLAALDYGFQRFKFEKDIRMTKDEIKREMKEQEASMETKMAQAKFRRKLRNGSLASAVKEADVIVTNPTHFSVAIKYELGKDHAPKIVAKGQDLLAFKIREIAGAENIPIVPNPPLARALYRQCEVGEFVPREYFQTVAEVLAYVYRTLKKVR